MELYHKASQSLTDVNSCVPKALAILADRDAAEVNAMMVRDGIREPSRGCYASKYLPWANNELALDLQEINWDWKGKGITVNNITECLDPDTRYFVIVRGHALAIVNGEVQDWSVNRRHRVNRVFGVGSSKLRCLPQRNSSPQQTLMLALAQQHADSTGYMEAPFRSGNNKVRVATEVTGRTSSVYFEMLKDRRVRIDMTSDVAACLDLFDELPFTRKPNGRLFATVEPDHRAIRLAVQRAITW